MKKLALVFVLLGLNGCAFFAPAPEVEKLRLSPVSFDDLPGWNDDRVAEALPALRKSCDVFLKRSDDKAMGIGGTARDWKSACQALKDRAPQNEGEARAYLARYWRPYQANDGKGGLFTGYYEATLRGSWERQGPFQTPLWKRPRDMAVADLGDFLPELKGRKITGKVQGNSFIPYDDRAAVSQNSLQGRADPLLWTDDPITAFFLEIQGSGRVTMTDGSVLRIGFEAQNGKAFVPIGRTMADQGLVEKPVTMKKIRTWLEKNPKRAQAIMNQNPSVIFFAKKDADGAVGAQGLVLTPRRSMAVDPSFIPLGTPLWVAMDNRAAGGNPRLVVAQDTGGAIKGPVRGDMFYGAGVDAEAGAGNLQSTGTYYLLLPKDVSVRAP